MRPPLVSYSKLSSMVYLNNFIKEKQETLIYGWIIHGQSLFENKNGNDGDKCKSDFFRP